MARRSLREVYPSDCTVTGVLVESGAVIVTYGSNAPRNGDEMKVFLLDIRDAYQAMPPGSHVLFVASDANLAWITFAAQHVEFFQSTEWMPVDLKHKAASVSVVLPCSNPVTSMALAFVLPRINNATRDSTVPTKVFYSGEEALCWCDDLG